MKTINLEAKKRDIIGKKVKKLRQEGILPVTVYGKKIKSVSLTVPTKEFLQVYGKAGETGLVELKFDGQSLPTLISNVQINALSRLPLHVEFRAVNLTEKIKANVPVELLGESPAVQNNIGVLLQTINEIEVESLPTDLPEKVGVDVAALAEVGQQVTVGQLKLPPGVEVLTNTEDVVVKVASAVSEETQKELEAEEAAKAAAEATPAEGAPVAEEAKSTEEGQKESIVEKKAS